jgi:hypothetical protein
MGITYLFSVVSPLLMLSSVTVNEALKEQLPEIHAFTQVCNAHRSTLPFGTEVLSLEENVDPTTMGRCPKGIKWSLMLGIPTQRVHASGEDNLVAFIGGGD